jgi:hypothetical protein
MVVYSGVTHKAEEGHYRGDGGGHARDEVDAVSFRARRSRIAR